MCGQSGKDLTEKQSVELTDIINKNADRKKIYELTKKLKLIPPKVEFKRKRKLKKLTPAQKIVRRYIYGLSFAAMVALFITLYVILPKNHMGNGQIPVTQNEKYINQVRNNPPEVTENITPKENSAKPQPGLKNEFSKAQKLNSSSKIILPKKTAVIDSISNNADIKPAIISKIEFKQDIKLFEEPYRVSLVVHNTPEVESSFITSEEPRFGKLIVRIFREKIHKSQIPEVGALKAYEIADAGITGLNKILGWQMSLQQNRDVNGELTSLYFNSKLLKFNAPVKKVVFIQ